MATPQAALQKPSKDEYAPYYEKYISLLPEGDIIAILEQQIGPTLALLRGLDDLQGLKRYAEGKWSVKEVVGHLIDSERVFAYRALRFARNDQTELPGYEQDDFIHNSNFDAVPMADLAAELEHVRRANVLMFRSLEEQAWSRRGIANEDVASVRAIAHMIAGHELHHVSVLKGRYLS